MLKLIRGGRMGRRVGLVFCLALVALMLIRLARRDEVVGRETPIVLDDFAFAVRDFRSEDAPGDPGGGPTNRARLLVVRLEIMNRARRVPFTFRPDSALLVDASGGERGISRDLQSVHDREDATRSPYRPPIKAGESGTVNLVFAAPKDPGPCQFRLSMGGPIGDLLEAIFYRRRRIALDR